MPHYRRSAAAAVLALSAKPRISPHDLAMRLAERDQRQAADTRTDAEKFLGDPPRERSALVQGRAVPGDTAQKSASECQRHQR